MIVDELELPCAATCPFSLACGDQYRLTKNCVKRIDLFISQNINAKLGSRIFRNGQIEVDTESPDGHVSVSRGRVYFTHASPLEK